MNRTFPFGMGRFNTSEGDGRPNFNPNRFRNPDMDTSTAPILLGIGGGLVFLTLMLVIARMWSRLRPVVRLHSDDWTVLGATVLQPPSLTPQCPNSRSPNTLSGEIKAVLTVTTDSSHSKLWPPLRRRRLRPRPPHPLRNFQPAAHRPRTSLRFPSPLVLVNYSRQTLRRLPSSKSKEVPTPLALLSLHRHGYPHPRRRRANDLPIHPVQALPRVLGSGRVSRGASKVF